MTKRSLPEENRSEAVLEDGLPVPLRYWAVLTTSLAIGIAVMDNTILNVALPVIAEDLGVAPAQSVWVVNAYLLALATMLLPIGSLGEIVGYRRVYRCGLVVFTAASLACALAESLPALVAARLLQGIGAAGIVGVNIALVRFIYPRASLGRGIGINAMVVAVSTTLGPVVAAGILSTAPWPWLFVINIPIGCLALVFGRSLPRTPLASYRFDIESAFLNVLGVGLLVLAINSLTQGVSVLVIATELAVGIAAAYVLVQRQLSMESPLVPVDLLQLRAFAAAVVTSVCAFAGHMIAFIALPFYLHNKLGYSPVQTGLLMTPWPLVLVVMAPLSGYLADRYPAGFLCASGSAVMGIGLSLLALLPADPGIHAILWRMALCGIGFGLFHVPNNRTMINSAPRSRSGAAAGMQGTARLFGQTTGAALTALIFGISGDSTSTALLVATGFTTAAIVAALAGVGSGTRESHWAA